MVISHNAVMRHISGNSRWQLDVDNQDCRTANGSPNGGLRIRLHGSGGNYHFPAYIKGVCYRTTGQARLNSGSHVISMRQTCKDSPIWVPTGRILGFAPRRR